MCTVFLKSVNKSPPKKIPHRKKNIPNLDVLNRTFRCCKQIVKNKNGKSKIIG